MSHKKQQYSRSPKLARHAPGAIKPPPPLPDPGTLRRSPPPGPCGALLRSAVSTDPPVTLKLLLLPTSPMATCRRHRRQAKMSLGDDCRAWSSIQSTASMMMEGHHSACRRRRRYRRRKRIHCIVLFTKRMNAKSARAATRGTRSWWRRLCTASAVTTVIGNIQNTCSTHWIPVKGSHVSDTQWNLCQTNNHRCSRVAGTKRQASQFQQERSTFPIVAAAAHGCSIGKHRSDGLLLLLLHTNTAVPGYCFGHFFLASSCKRLRSIISSRIRLFLLCLECRCTVIQRIDAGQNIPL